MAADEEIPLTPTSFKDPVAKFKETLASIGGAAIEIENENQIPGRLLTILPGRDPAHQVGPDDPAKTNADAYNAQATPAGSMRGVSGFRIRA